MALSDPQSIKIGTTTTSLPRTSSGTNSGVFTSNDGTIAETVSHQYGKKNRHLLRIDHSKIAADPLTSANTRYQMGTYLVIEVPPVGYTVAEAKAVVDGFIATLTANTGSLVTQVLGGEN